MSQVNNKKVNLIAIMAIVATLIVGIPGYRIFFVKDKEEQKPFTINNIISLDPAAGDSIFPGSKNTTNKKDSNSRITNLEQNRAKPPKIDEGYDNTESNNQSALNETLNLNGFWRLTIKADSFISPKKSVKIGRPNIVGHIELHRTDNQLKGSFTSPSWIQFKNAAVSGTIKNDSLFIDLNCTKGYCANNAGLKIVARIYDNNTISGNCLPIGEPQGKCGIYIGHVSIEKAFISPKQ